jgi:hypothetical protein
MPCQKKVIDDRLDKKINNAQSKLNGILMMKKEPEIHNESYQKPISTNLVRPNSKSL